MVENEKLSLIQIGNNAIIDMIKYGGGVKDIKYRIYSDFISIDI